MPSPVMQIPPPAQLFAKSVSCVAPGRAALFCRQAAIEVGRCQKKTRGNQRAPFYSPQFSIPICPALDKPFCRHALKGGVAVSVYVV